MKEIFRPRPRSARSLGQRLKSVGGALAASSENRTSMRKTRRSLATSVKRGVTPGVGVMPIGRRWKDMGWKIHILPKLDEAVIRQLEEADTKKENSLWKSSSSRRGFRRNDNYYTAEEDMKIVRYIVDNGGKKQTTKIKL